MKQPSPLKKKASYWPHFKKNLFWLLLGPLVIASGGVLEIYQTNYMADIVNVINNHEAMTDEQVKSVILSNGGVMVMITLGAV